VQAAQRRDALGTRAQRQVIRVAQDDPRPQPLEIRRRQRLDRRLRSHRHEHGRLDVAVRGRQHAGAGAAGARDDAKRARRRAHEALLRISIASP
jgi:hypothetical protein